MRWTMHVQIRHLMLQECSMEAIADYRPQEYIYPQIYLEERLKAGLNETLCGEAPTR